MRTQIVVEAPIERAFSVFTEEFGSFKPPEHNMLDVEIAETVFEPHVGGNIYDRGVDGSECRWARVLAYEPPNRVVFSWDISPQWQIETDLEKTSEVEVRFVAEAPERTRVELEHRNLDRHGPGWEPVRDGSTATPAGRSTWRGSPSKLRPPPNTGLMCLRGRPARPAFSVRPRRNSTIEPGDDDQLVTGIHAVERRLQARVECKPGVGRALVTLVGR